MKYLMRMKKEGGFSLVELMVAVGIIGTMSTVAVPRYQKFSANAAQSEAQTSLSSIYTLQQLFFTEHDKYVTGFGAGKINFDVPTDARYNYNTEASGADDTLFKATAVSKTKLASCAAAANDKWCVNEKKELRNTNPIPAPCVAADIANGGCS